MAKLAIMVKGQARSGRRDDVRRLFEEHLAPRAAGNPEQQIVVWCADASEPDTESATKLRTEIARASVASCMASSEARKAGNTAMPRVDMASRYQVLQQA